MRIYADNAATTKISEKALDVMVMCMRNICANPSSQHIDGQRAKNVLEDARRKVAEVLNCNPKEIYFTSSGSESDNQAILTAAAAGEKQGKKHILASAFEHKAVLAALERLKERGFEIEYIYPSEDGVILPSQIKKAIRDDTALVTMMYANNEVGTIQPVKETGAICREKNVIFHTDAVQAAGHIPVDVQEDNIDMMSLSSHKFHGPLGAGIFYCKKVIEPVSLITGGGQERGKRAGTENLPAIAGMAAALKEATEGMEAAKENVIAKRDYLITELGKIEGARLNGDPVRRLPSNVNFSFEGVTGETLVMILDEKGISASSGSACMSGSAEPGHVLKAMGRSDEEALNSLRLSIGEDISWEETKYIAAAVKEAVERIRRYGI